MRSRRKLDIKRTVLFAIIIASAACVKAPASYTPQIAAQFYATQTIHYLDAIRDFANNGNKTTPPIVSDAALHVVIDWHESIAKTLRTTPDGWRATALVGLDELRSKLPAAEAARFRAVIDAAKIYIQES